MKPRFLEAKFLFNIRFRMAQRDMAMFAIDAIAAAAAATTAAAAAAARTIASARR